MGVHGLTHIKLMALEILTLYICRKLLMGVPGISLKWESVGENVSIRGSLTQEKFENLTVTLLLL